MWTGKMRLPRNIKIACNHSGLTHYGGIFFFHEFLRVLQFRRRLAQAVDEFRLHHDYSLSESPVIHKWTDKILYRLGKLQTLAP
jgi:hypothetical protein